MSLLWFPIDTRQALSEQGQEQLMMQASASEFLDNTTHSVGPWVQPPTVPPQPGILAAPLWSIVPGCPRACL